MIKKNTIIAALFLPILVFSQKIDHLVSFRDIDKSNYFRLNYDNDYFSASDKNYTQGYNLEFIAPSFRKNPINVIFFTLNTSHVVKEKYGIALEHIGFTASNYVSPAIQVGDRPFAAAIYIKSFYMATNTLTKLRLTSTFNLGIIGPGAFGEEMQVAIHEWTGNKIPKGWRNQIKNDVVLNYEIGIEKQIIQYDNFFSLPAHSNLKLGTLFTNASLGTSTQIGLINSVYQGDKTKKPLQFYFYTEIKGALIAYDATLQGGILNRESVYTIRSKNIRHFTGQLNYGLVMKTKTWYLEYTRTLHTREITSVKSANWGGIKIGFTL